LGPPPMSVAKLITDDVVCDGAIQQLQLRERRRAPEELGV
jgi:hypothetical protein